ncbi:type II CRISPR RNA-guided endonuclease Cas9 [Alteraurantiacibacter aquimixticola]|uniref:CRISPR-associated endonuclease Cas9 n=2 Tax=Alteraurantiacibacter aquimixticola TaxID=2489173 RepID=A0A4V4U8M3_9SPHN|nr:type II CRISPR RNA-guided endonuclease Cas9 [Alteraurantiacibacter aquimixticola]
MRTRLGLDIGTNSIGWCLYDGDTIRNIGVRIFPDGRDPKSGASLAVDRRDARAMRRRRDRYLGRRSALVEVLVEHGLLPQDKQEAQALHGEDPYALRARALDEKLTPQQIGRALFHLNQRRGFKSNRKADRVAKVNDDGKIASGTKALDQAMADAGARTLGEFLLLRDPDKGEAKRVRMRPDANGYDFYPDRRHYENEFEAIWAKQAEYHPDFLTIEAKAAIHRVIFFQRPLKAQVVGKCSFAGWYGIPGDEKRLPKAHPLFQQRRLFEEVNQLEVVSAGAPARKLTLDERHKLILKLQDKKKVTFKTLGRLIKLKEGERFNKESENRKDLIGDEVRAEMMHADRFGPDWTTFSTGKQWAIIERLLEEEDTEKLLAWLQSEHGLYRETAEAIANAHLPDGHGRFGLTATTALLEQLKAHVVTYAQAAERAGYHHSDHRTGECHAALPYYGEILAREIAPGKDDYSDELERQWGKITNPTVHIGLNQLRRLVNAILRQYGRPDYIYVELARELKLNEKQKAEHNRRIRQTTDEAAARSKKLAEIGERDSGGNRMLLRIWEQLNPANPLDRRCPYCGEMISIEMLMNGSADIDHIIPYSRCLDDSVGNKVVSHTHCNRQKGNKTPWERWGETDRWPVIQDQVARLHKSKQWRFGPDAMERVERGGGFVARQLTDTQYLSRIAGKYLSSLYTPDEGRRVYAVTGRMTAMLRRLWGLNDILLDHNWVENEHSNAPKNRLDHRHHAIDAAVVGATDAAMIQKIATAAGRAEDQDLDRQFLDLPHPWEGFREDLRDKLYTTTVSFKPDHGRKGRPKKDRDITSGRLHNDTAYGLTGRTNAKGVPIVVTRKPLLSLKPGDLTDPDRMPDRDLQEALYTATRGTSGKEFEKSLRDFATRDGPYNGIRRVRLTEPLNVILIRDKEGRAYKAVKGDANARFDVWRLPDGKWVTKWKDLEGQEHSSIISMFDAHQCDFVEARPHPAAKKVLSLRQNDLIAVEHDGGEREIMRVVKFAARGEITFAKHNETGALKSRHEAGDDPFRYFTSSPSGLKASKARQVRIDELGRIHDPGPRD